MAEVIAIIADIVGSRELADRTAAQEALEATFARVNGIISLEEPFAPTVGDEFQAVAADTTTAIVATLVARLVFPGGLDCRFGLGAGESQRIASAAPDALRNGSAWWRAREAIDTAHRHMDVGRTTVRTWYAGEGDGIVNAHLVMRDHVIGRMKQVDRDLTLGQLLGRTQKELAREVGITQSAVSQRMERSGGSSLLTAVDVLGWAHHD